MFFCFIVDKKLNTTDEASLLIMCDLSQSGALEPWDYIKEIDLSDRQIYAKIVKLEFRYCMPVNDVSRLSIPKKYFYHVNFMQKIID